MGDDFHCEHEGCGTVCTDVGAVCVLMRGLIFTTQTLGGLNEDMLIIVGNWNKHNTLLGTLSSSDLLFL